MFGNGAGDWARGLREEAARLEGQIERGLELSSWLEEVIGIVGAASGSGVSVTCACDLSGFVYVLVKVGCTGRELAGALEWLEAAGLTGGEWISTVEADAGVKYTTNYVVGAGALVLWATDTRDCSLVVVGSEEIEEWVTVKITRPKYAVICPE